MSKTGRYAQYPSLQDKVVLITGGATGIGASMNAALASHFHHLDPRPIGGAPHRSLALGKQIYEEGLPEANDANALAALVRLIAKLALAPSKILRAESAASSSLFAACSIWLKACC